MIDWLIPQRIAGDFYAENPNRILDRSAPRVGLHLRSHGFGYSASQEKVELELA